MATILDFLLGSASGGGAAEPSAQAGGGWFDRASMKLPGAQYLSPEERQGAIGLALLRAGSAGLRAAQGGADGRPATIGQTAGAIAGGFGEGIQGMTDQALKGAAVQAQMLGRQKSAIEAQQLLKRNAAIQAFAAGDRSPEVLALINPDKALEQMYRPAEHLASKGMVVNPATGRVEYLPGYAEALTTEAEARSAGTWQPVQPGGSLLKPPAPGGSAAPAQPSLAGVMQNNPLYVASIGAAQRAGVDPGLYTKLIETESGFNATAKSPKGAIGPAQLMPDTAKSLGVNPNDPAQNVQGGAVYLRSMLDKYQGDTTKALMAYNWGPGNVDEWMRNGSDPSKVPPETHAYVRKIIGQSIGAEQPPAQQGVITDQAGRVIGLRSPDTAAESTFDKAAGEKLAGLYFGKQEANTAARQRVAKLQALSDTLKGIETGKGSEALLEGKRALKGLGVDLNAIGLTDNVGPQEAARALSNEMALELRNPAGGAGMPGAMSDKDREFLQSMSPGITTTAAGRALVVEAQRKIAERTMQEAKIVRDYARKKGGRLDIGVYDALDDLASKPVFDQEFMRRAQSVGGVSAQPVQGGGGRVMRWNPRTGRVE